MWVSKLVAWIKSKFKKPKPLSYELSPLAGYKTDFPETLRRDPAYYPPKEVYADPNIYRAPTPMGSHVVLRKEAVNKPLRGHSLSAVYIDEDDICEAVVAAAVVADLLSSSDDSGKAAADSFFSGEGGNFSGGGASGDWGSDD